MDEKTKFLIWYVVFAIIGILILNQLIVAQYAPQDIPYSEFLDALDEGRIVEVSITGDQIEGLMLVRDDPDTDIRFTTFRVEPELSEKLLEQGVTFVGRPERTFFRDLLAWVIPLMLFLGIWVLIMRRMSAGAGFMNIGQSKAKVYLEKDIKITFEDVAGVDEAKEELREVVDFLKNPEPFRRLGGRMPKGVLLVGPPGTGKTLLAKAVAGEAGVPFFSISGSDFIQMFVGVGAARVRDMFKQARETAPCIIFVDELDAVGKARAGAGGFGGGHEEREQTLNQLLSEMDGFDPREGIIILAATNQPETLDPALLRAGRFDRNVLVDKPDFRGRIEILKLHAKKIKLSDNVDLETIARMTPGFSGADLANVINEAALLATRKNKEEVEMPELEEAVDRTIAGLAKKNRVINPKEKKIVAYHETGHALVAAFTPGADKVKKITIVPRGIGALGYTQQLPTEDRYLMTRQELQGKIDVLLGGRITEALVFEEVSTGAQNDLQRATDIARAMVSELGMGKTLGLSTYPRQRRPVFLDSEHSPFQGKEYSESTAAQLDVEVKDLLSERESVVRKLLSEHLETLHRVAEHLLEKEVLDEKEFNALIEPPPPPPPNS
ncbi:membrane protease FtsH catalytic subunit [Desulfonatronum thiosulfatophilum]|uniref:ATP-dependent zinc metalloprotease FtsH n=1 Tax=Desulfonatronum thiosulfatophilum TaxID=617002 RepID=A0A1G6E564_9BACT|nr:ATP-dependent zinc metalloprotease FtsH [Desulfonatronum thiosulfatophilum]SDB52075.1 membrane protease FtsH catalytic subunit [Desulfonatronum thiosulfatophilum]